MSLAGAGSSGEGLLGRGLRKPACTFLIRRPHDPAVSHLFGLPSWPVPRMESFSVSTCEGLCCAGSFDVDLTITTFWSQRARFKSTEHRRMLQKQELGRCSGNRNHTWWSFPRKRYFILCRDVRSRRESFFPWDFMVSHGVRMWVYVAHVHVFMCVCTCVHVSRRVRKLQLTVDTSVCELNNQISRCHRQG